MTSADSKPNPRPTQTRGLIRGKRPGRKPSFTREDVIEAAFQEGLLTFTISSVAKRLGVAPSALYREFSSREELLYSAVEALGRYTVVPASNHASSESTAEVTAEVTAWEDELRLYADLLWQICFEHPEFPQLMMLYPELFTNVETAIDAWANNFVKLGIPGGKESALFALDFVGDIVISTAFMLFQLAQKDEGGTQRLESLREKSKPGLNLYDPNAWSDRGMFPQKLEFIIAGLKAGFKT